jgi:hypothetical protein
MKLTKKILREHKIYNSYDVAKKLGSKIFIDYIPACNDRLVAHHAFWRFMRLVDAGYNYKDFTVTCRENKLPILQEVIKFVKEKCNIDITDKDPFGAYHPKGTLKKLEALIKSDKE